ncbi:helix-turn-helix domain-containing protein [Ignavigranum ruoffiae]
MEKYAEIIQSERTKRKLSQQAFGKEIGLSQSSVALIELGKRRPSDKVKERISDFFNLCKFQV